MADGRPTPGADPPASNPSVLKRFKLAVKRMKREVLAIYYSMQEPDCPWYARLLASVAVAYVISPLDLIPDFIPVLGLVDDLLIVGALLGLAIRAIPSPVLERARQRAEREPLRLGSSWPMAVLFFLMWDALLLWLLALGLRWQGGAPLQRPAVWWGIMGGTTCALVAAEATWLACAVRRERHGRREQQEHLQAQAEAGEAVSPTEPLLGRGGETS